MDAAAPRPPSIDAPEVARLATVREARAPRPPLIDATGAALFVAGASAVHRLAGLPDVRVALAWIACGAILVALRGRASRLVGWAALGFGLCVLAGTHALATRWPVARDGEDVRARVTVRGLPEAFAQGWRFDADLRLAATGATAVRDPRVYRARLGWFDRDARPRTGESFDAVLRMRAPRGTRNPGAFDFERHAIARGIDATGYVRSVDAATRAPARAASHPIERLRAHVRDRVAATLGETRAGALIVALTIGEQAAIGDDEWRVVRATGIAHLIAISGFHVAMVAIAGVVLPALLLRVFPTLALRWPRRQWLRAGVLSTAAVYGAVAGGAVPVLRTVAMLALVSAFAWTRRRLSIAAVLGAAAIAVVALDPLATLSAGFWLSFAGVAWLVHALSGRSRESTPRVFVRAQLVVSLALAPVGIALFQQLSLAGPVVNLVAVPWFSVVLVPASLLATVLATLGMPGGDVALHGAAALAEWTWRAAAFVAASPLAEFDWPEPTLPSLVVAIVGLAIVLAPRGVPGRAFGALLVVPLATTTIATREPPLAHGAFALDVIDVGQGTAVLVRTRHHAVLYDTGPASPDRIDMGESAVLPVLVARGRVVPDRIVVSHADSDHAGGLAAIHRRHDVPIVAGPDLRERLDADAAHAPRAVTTCIAGDGWTHDGVRFAFLHPPAHFPALGNDSSCVLRIDGAIASALLPGDLSQAIEARLVAARAPLRADVVVVPHHGSRGSSSAAFVDAVGASLAIVSAGWHNRFGHPAADVVARYVAAGAQVIDTADAGLVGVRFDARGRPVATGERTQQPRWWASPRRGPGPV